ncbi:MAG TPA: alcohol dehydrogenase [Myxococcales bacterium]|jgi:NADPH:quinone reductase-like Zn-dependent oxidoreductase|nr:alcohol dehydrogenase [Myxococcales bacterium]
MRAVVIRGHGGPERLEVLELPAPEPKPGEVRVRVKACAISHLDLWVREGWPGLRLNFPHVLGAEVAGSVDALGAGVSDIEPGAPVLVAPGLSCGACQDCLSGRDNHCRQYHLLGERVCGGYAELVCVPRQNLVPMPAQLTFEQAACLPLVFQTAWEMLVRRAALQAGETVLVHAAGGGVGSAAVQIARLLGARVLATVGSDAKVDKALALGADEVINYEKQDFLAEVWRLTGRRGVDVVFEHTGARTFERSVASLAVGGRLVTCGATSGAETQLDIRMLFWRRISLLGSTTGSKGDLFDIARLVGEGKLRPVLDRALPLEEAARGHGLLVDRAQFGKVVLVP